MSWGLELSPSDFLPFLRSLFSGAHESNLFCSWGSYALLVPENSNVFIPFLHSLFPLSHWPPSFLLPEREDAVFRTRFPRPSAEGGPCLPGTGRATLSLPCPSSGHVERAGEPGRGHRQAGWALMDGSLVGPLWGPSCGPAVPALILKCDMEWGPSGKTSGAPVMSPAPFP